MIQSTSEHEWLAYLSKLAKLGEWKPPNCRTVLLTPHPDDETLSAGGLINDLTRLGVDVHIVAVSDGENAYPEVKGLGPLRVQEQIHALKLLGVTEDKIIRLRMTDSSVGSDEAALEKKLIRIIDKDTHLVAPWYNDFHPDHQAVGRVARKVAEKRGAMLTYYFFWTWHQGKPSQMEPLALKKYSLTPKTLETKLQALSCYRSQLDNLYGDPILPENLLLPAKRTFEVYFPAL